MCRLLPCLAAFVALAGAPLEAAPRFRLATVITHTNDFFVDGQDRWRTASVSASVLWGPEFSGQAPSEFGALLEARTRFEMIAPANLSLPDPSGDRPYVGALALGVFSHQKIKNTELSLGADLVLLGPSTGVSQLQTWLHQRIAPINPLLLESQIADAVYPTVSAEIARSYALSPNLAVRPFFAAQIGVETFARAGFDLTIGTRPPQDLRLREPVTGQRIPALHVWGQRSWGLGLGADLAYIADSHYFRASDGLAIEPLRTRLKAGAFYQGDRLDAFYGVSWLSPEFSTQSGGQLVAALSVSLRF